MKHILSLFGILVAAMVCAADVAPSPAWMSAEYRMAQFPNERYASSLVMGECSNTESIEVALQRTRDNARAEVVASIITDVESTTLHHMQNQQVHGTQGYSELLKTDLLKSTTIHAEIKDIPNLSVESWHDTKSHAVYAFAWIKKSDLVRALKKQIISNLTRAEMAIEEAEGLLAEGEKGAARKAVAKAIELLEHVEQQQKVVLSVDNSTELEDIAFTESNALKQRATALQQQLKNAVTVYVGGDVTIFDTNYSTFVNEIKQQISDIGCTFTTNEAEADWVIQLQGTTREYNTLQTGTYTAYFVLAEVVLQIVKGNTQSIIYEGSFSEKGSHTLNRDEAGYAAYKEVYQKITAKIKEIINN